MPVSPNFASSSSTLVPAMTLSSPSSWHFLGPSRSGGAGQAHDLRALLILEHVDQMLGRDAADDLVGARGQRIDLDLEQGIDDRDDLDPLLAGLGDLRLHPAFRDDADQDGVRIERHAVVELRDLLVELGVAAGREQRRLDAQAARLVHDAVVHAHPVAVLHVREQHADVPLLRGFLERHVVDGRRQRLERVELVCRQLAEVEHLDGPPVLGLRGADAAYQQQTGRKKRYEGAPYSCHVRFLPMCTRFNSRWRSHPGHLGTDGPRVPFLSAPSNAAFA